MLSSNSKLLLTSRTQEFGLPLAFELITGYVFSSPNNVIDSIPGTLMLTDCLETCQGNESCQSVNYETGLCVLFESNADLLPER
ncbi:hypothetical protein HUJ05_012211 [Dendroctonus ponderosae]|nr:hypothetical protein HUJ05_012211 [Dendroctonus ponderosae]